MARPFSLDLRQRIVNAVKNGESRLSAARRFNVCNKTVAKYLKLNAAGSLEPKKSARRSWRKFTDEAIEALKSWLEEKNDLTLKQLQQRLLDSFQLQVSLPGIWERLTVMNLTML
ncbi:MAG: IS630 transposase-related protein [Syntrophorhabdaceae bacterium]|nr:IS630 transposase-related protein [Syntrophorhabdaceae bacterium]